MGKSVFPVSDNKRKAENSGSDDSDRSVFDALSIVVVPAAYLRLETNLDFQTKSTVNIQEVESHDVVHCKRMVTGRRLSRMMYGPTKVAY